MQDIIVTVKAHPIKENGWAIFENGELANLLNDNYFSNKVHADLVARARRHVLFMKALKELTKKKIL